MLINYILRLPFAKFFTKFFALITSLIIALLGTIIPPPTEYKTKSLFADEGFENGFTVMSMQTQNGQGVPLGNFTYNALPAQPEWMIAQWGSKYCLWDERAESDIYTITDGKTKTVTYNPDNKSLSMRLNAANVYGGLPAGEGNWPHLLLEQSPLKVMPGDSAFYSCAADKLMLTLDIKLTDFKDTTNKEGINAAQYLAYFYITGVSGNEFVWFGVNLFDSRGLQDTYWNVDTAGSNQMIYTISTADTYGCKLKSLTPFGKPRVSEKWTHINLNLTPHIQQMIEKANESNLFGQPVTADDFTLGGTNIGFEIHGNYDCTVQIKNFQITSYLTV